MKRTRYVMKLDLTQEGQPSSLASTRFPFRLADLDGRARTVTQQDVSALAALLIAAYRGTIDDEGESPAEAVREMSSLFSGKYGELLNDASFLAELDGEIVATSLITCWKEVPLVAHIYTHPLYQRRGLARFVLQASIRALRAAGYPELVLYVTVGNAGALRLYMDLGFAAVESYEEDFNPGGEAPHIGN